MKLEHMYYLIPLIMLVIMFISARSRNKKSEQILKEHYGQKAIFVNIIRNSNDRGINSHVGHYMLKTDDVEIHFAVLPVINNDGSVTSFEPFTEINEDLVSKFTHIIVEKYNKEVFRQSTLSKIDLYNST